MARQTFPPTSEEVHCSPSNSPMLASDVSIFAAVLHIYISSDLAYYNDYYQK